MTLTLHEHPFAAYCWKALIALYQREGGTVVTMRRRLGEGRGGQEGG